MDRRPLAYATNRNCRRGAPGAGPIPHRRGGIRRHGGTVSPVHRLRPRPIRKARSLACLLSAPKLWCPGRMGAGCCCCCCASCLSEIISFAERRSGRRVGAGAGPGLRLRASACARHASISAASRRLLVFFIVRRLGPVRPRSACDLSKQVRASRRAVPGELASHARLSAAQAKVDDRSRIHSHVTC